MIRHWVHVVSLCLAVSPAAYSQLVIEGVGSTIEATLRGQISQLDNSCNASEARARGIARQSVRDAEDVLRALGFYQPQIDQSLELNADNCQQVRLRIEPGVRTRIVEIDVQVKGAGETDSAFIELLQQVPFLEGDPLLHNLYESYKAQFERLAVRHGYYDARFSDSQIRVDPQQAEAAIVLHYDTGVRYSYGEVIIEEAGPSVDFVRRYVPFQEGDPVDSAELIETQQKLINSQYFAAVSVRPLIAERRNGRVDVQIGLTPVKTWHYSIGAGFDTNTGPRASLAVENRLLNPEGDRASADLSLSPNLKQFELSHRHPLTDPTREFRQWTFGIRDEETDSSTSTRQSLGWSRVLAMDGGWIRTLGASYRREVSEIGTLDIKSELFLPTIAWHKTSRQGDRRITQGWRANLDLSVAVRNFLSDTSLVQAHAETKGIISMGPGRLIGRLELGTTWVEQFVEVPASLRYFAGGDSSVRGYDFDAIGPRDSEDNVVGGRHLLVGSLEYDIPVAENWDVALFTDVGDAFNNEPSVKQSVGIGLRWHSLVGTIRLDLAVPTDGGGMRLHIFMGPQL